MKIETGNEYVPSIWCEELPSTIIKYTVELRDKNVNCYFDGIGINVENDEEYFICSVPLPTNVLSEKIKDNWYRYFWRRDKDQIEIIYIPIEMLLDTENIKKYNSLKANQLKQLINVQNL